VCTRRHCVTGSRPGASAAPGDGHDAGGPAT
jgi:hypothetical protein